MIKLEDFEKQLIEGKTTIDIPQAESNNFENKCVEAVSEYAHKAHAWRNES